MDAAGFTPDLSEQRRFAGGIEPLLSMLRQGVAAAAPLVVFVALCVAGWAWLSRTGVIPRYLLPSPDALALAIYSGSDVLLRHASFTLQEALGGFLLGNVVAVGASIVFAASAAIRVCFYPLALASRAVPIVAITPLLVILLGRGMVPIIAVVAISVYFPTLLNMLRGLRSADVEYHELLHTLAASRWQRLRIIELPACLPYLFAALKVGASAAFISAIVGEWIGANSGLGYLIVISASYFHIPAMWAAITVAAALTLLLVGVVSLAERLATPWRHASVGELP
jgi:NitT/TauT family transport system permease protein